METANYIGDANQITYETLVCSANLTEGTQKQLIFHSVLNILLSTTAFVGNTPILVALHKESSLHPPSKLLFRCVTTTDLCVAVIVEPLAVMNWISVAMVNEQWSICCYSSAVPFITAYMLCHHHHHHHDVLYLYTIKLKKQNVQCLC